MFSELLAIFQNQYVACAHESIVKTCGADFSTTGTDMAGSTALAYSINTKPCFNPEFAQIMLDAGGDINRRDRFGAIIAHDITTVHLYRNNTAAYEKAGRALQWFLEHGGNLDVEDGEGTTARRIIAALEPTDRTLTEVADRAEKLRSEGGDPGKGAVGRPTARNSPCPCGSGHKFKKCCGKD